jgi:hypothetical protein
MQIIKVKPADGLVIRDPLLRDFIETDGRVVEMNDYWARRLRDMDVVEVPLEQPAAEQPAT